MLAGSQMPHTDLDAITLETAMNREKVFRANLGGIADSFRRDTRWGSFIWYTPWKLWSEASNPVDKIVLDYLRDYVTTTSENTIVVTSAIINTDIYSVDINKFNTETFEANPKARPFYGSIAPFSMSKHDEKASKYATDMLIRWQHTMPSIDDELHNGPSRYCLYTYYELETVNEFKCTRAVHVRSSLLDIFSIPGIANIMRTNSLIN